MKKLQKIVVLVIVVGCFCLMLTACRPPRTRDTSMVAGTYHQQGEDGLILHKFIELRADGTWTTSNDAKLSGSNQAGTFTLKDNNTKISVYSGNMEVIYGTIADDTLTLNIWHVLWWEEEVVFVKD